MKLKGHSILGKYQKCNMIFFYCNDDNAALYKEILKTYGGNVMYIEVTDSRPWIAYYWRNLEPRKLHFFFYYYYY